MTFEFYSEGVLIGTSELENGDPPMGVAIGAFKPTEAFDKFRSAGKRELDGPPGNQSELTVWENLVATMPDGTSIECSGGGISVIEYGPADAPEYMEAQCLGISSPPYELIFPHHVAAYAARFRNE